MGTIEANFAQRINESCGYKRADMAELKQQLKELKVKKSTCPFHCQADIAGQIDFIEEVASDTVKGLFRQQDQIAKNLEHLKSDPKELMIEILKLAKAALNRNLTVYVNTATDLLIATRNNFDFKNKTLDKAIDHISHLHEEKKLSGEQYGFLKNTFLLIGGINTAITQTGLTISKILDSKESKKPLLEKAGLNFIKQLASMPVDIFFIFDKLIRLESSQKPVNLGTGLLEWEINNTPYSYNVVKLTTNKMGIEEKKLNQFINLFNRSYEETLKKVKENIKNLSFKRFLQPFNKDIALKLKKLQRKKAKLLNKIVYGCPAKYIKIKIPKPGGGTQQVSLMEAIYKLTTNIMLKAML